MPYATQSDIEDVFGTANVATYSQLDNSVDTADTDRIARAIAWADAYIDGRLRGLRWALPVSGTQASITVTDWAANLAGYWLMRPRGLTEEMVETKARIDREIDMLAAGTREWDAATKEPQPTAPVIVGGR